MNKNILPPSMRMLAWLVAIALFALIALTGYIAIQIAGIERDVNQLQQTL